MLISDIEKWKTLRKSLNKNIGFIPTMGCLHKGHESLIQRSIEENNITILSIFVNPAQFNDSDDYNNYPSTMESDIKMAEKCGVDFILAPTKEQIYPFGAYTKVTSTHPFATTLEGKYRPGHLDGVLTVVMKLLALVKPTRAYFGEKDYQQVFLVNELAKEYFLDVEIVRCPTVREKSGIPCSSRNNRLTSEEMCLAEQFFKRFISSERDDINALKAYANELDIHIDYIESYKDRLFSAIKIGNIRLIDNKLLGDFHAG